MVVLTYNHKEFIKETIESIFSQDYSGQFDIVIADDASRDGTQEIIRELIDNHPWRSRITFLANDINRGVCPNIIQALSHAKGEYIIAMGGDDINRVDRVSEMVRLIRQYPHIKAFGSEYIRFDDSAHIPLEDDLESDTIHHYKERMRIDDLHVVLGCAAMWHRDLITQFGDFSQATGEDLVFSYRSFLLRSDTVISGKRLVYYRQHPASIANKIGLSGNQAREKFARFALANLSQCVADVVYLYNHSNRSYREIEFLLNQIHHQMNVWVVFPNLFADLSPFRKWRCLKSMIISCPKRLLHFLCRKILRKEDV